MRLTPTAVVFSILLPSCGGAASNDAPPTTAGDAGSDAAPVALPDAGAAADVGADASPTVCTLAANTSPTSTAAPDGCAVEDRDTSGCRSARVAQGLSGFWLDFSCRVTLTMSGTTVSAQGDSQPDYLSYYFATSSPCHEDYTAAIQNPNLISAATYTASLPLTPDTTEHQMRGAIVGVAADGVSIYGNFAAPGDDIYQEAKTFDRCGGHPDPTGRYHFHSEPYSLTYDDDRFVGVMLDGYPIYGRKDPDGSYPTVDADGGHTGTTIHSPTTPVYHYHVNQQTNASGTSLWFITKGYYRGTPGTCSGCN
jgi:hypothetical protein